MKYFSTFSGIGGFELGIHNAYLKHAPVGEKPNEKERTQGRERSVDESGVQLHTGDGSAPLCVGYSEIDKYATKVYERHFPNHENYGDITKINADELPDFDCLVGGFPCQAFSIAGKRGGFDDTRGTLFFDLARILRAKQPRLFVFENVKGLLNHDSGRTFATIVQTIDELGYDCQWQVLNSKNHGVPQNRERVIIVGHLRGTPRPEVFPIGITNEVHTQSNADKEEVHHVASTQTARQYASWNGNFVGVITGQPKYGAGERSVEYSISDEAPTLRATHYKNGDNQPKIVGGLQAHQTPRSDGISPTLTSAMGMGGGQIPVLLEPCIRRLTPVECERLQAFPDDWTKYGKNGELISDTQRYKMCGNAVTTNVIRDVFERIFQ